MSETNVQPGVQSGLACCGSREKHWHTLGPLKPLNDKLVVFDEKFCAQKSVDSLTVTTNPEFLGYTATVSLRNGHATRLGMLPRGAWLQYNLRNTLVIHSNSTPLFKMWNDPFSPTWKIRDPSSGAILFTVSAGGFANQLHLFTIGSGTLTASVTSRSGQAHTLSMEMNRWTSRGAIWLSSSAENELLAEIELARHVELTGGSGSRTHRLLYVDLAHGVDAIAILAMILVYDAITLDAFVDAPVREPNHL